MAGEASAATMTMRTHRSSLFALVLSVAALLLPACSPSHSGRIVIGSKNFTEPFIFGELIAQQFDSHTSLKVDRRFYLAWTCICLQAALALPIALYSEYTGTPLTSILKQPAGGHKAARS